jgi:CheY-like chemotaxis protein
MAARDGEEALQLAGEYDGPIHLPLADVVLPGMGAREVAERLGAAQPS